MIGKMVECYNLYRYFHYIKYPEYNISFINMHDITKYIIKNHLPNQIISNIWSILNKNSLQLDKISVSSQLSVEEIKCHQHLATLTAHNTMTSRLGENKIKLLHAMITKIHSSLKCVRRYVTRANMHSYSLVPPGRQEYPSVLIKLLVLFFFLIIILPLSFPVLKTAP